MLDHSLLTPQLRVAAIQGRVILAVLVRADGSVAQVTVRSTSGSGILDAAAMRAAQDWRFRPATRDGVAIDSWAIIPVRFLVP
jgi:protein TonB